jgi:hypothetical protein
MRRSSLNDGRGMAKEARPTLLEFSTNDCQACMIMRGFDARVAQLPWVTWGVWLLPLATPMQGDLDCPQPRNASITAGQAIQKRGSAAGLLCCGLCQ